MPLFYGTVNQLLINLVPFIEDALVESVDSGNLVSINPVLHNPPDLVINCIRLNVYFFSVNMLTFCLQCFDTVGWAAGRASACKKLSGGVLAWLSGARCRLAYGPADATATHSLLIQ